MKREVFYICNGKKPDCSKTRCVYTGAGDCGHTRDERYANECEHLFKEKEHGNMVEVSPDELKERPVIYYTSPGKEDISRMLVQSTYRGVSFENDKAKVLRCGQSGEPVIYELWIRQDVTSRSWKKVLRVATLDELSARWAELSGWVEAVIKAAGR